MTAKLTLIGQPQGLKVSNGIASFTITTGPASNTAPTPSGLPTLR